MKQRIITAVIAAALFIPFVVYGNLPFAILVYAMASIGLFEMLRMKGISIFTVQGIIGLLALYVILMPTEWAVKLEQATSFSQLEYLSMFALLLLIYTVLVKNKITFDTVGFILASVFYVGIGFHYFIETRVEGIPYIIFALVIVWSTDSGAYFVGRKLGKHKLWPEISPKKTIEGFVGGIIIAVIATVIFQYFAQLNVNYMLLLVVAIVASVVGQLGDLVESAIKRHYGVKDSGNILPGHGGILDRFDSLIFVLPLLHFIHFIG